jgi:hypothetical protein
MNTNQFSKRFSDEPHLETLQSNELSCNFFRQDLNPRIYGVKLGLLLSGKNTDRRCWTRGTQGNTFGLKDWKQQDDEELCITRSYLGVYTQLG